MSLRVYNDEKKEWLSWWLDGRAPANIGAPTARPFCRGTSARSLATTKHDGKPIKVRSQWTRTDTDSPRWEQAASVDDGKTWETNWVAEFRASDCAI